MENRHLIIGYTLMPDKVYPPLYGGLLYRLADVPLSDHQLKHGLII
ncbi:MAG: hypothetical protein PF904_09735 [Kiritimatiellae bacterium]|nr:hypothetical protein [Kiritimatiellia bacterium]